MLTYRCIPMELCTIPTSVLALILRKREAEADMLFLLFCKQKSIWLLIFVNLFWESDFETYHLNPGSQKYTKGSDAVCPCRQ